MLAEPQMVALTKRYQSQLDRITQATGESMQQVWSELGAHNEADIEHFLARVAGHLDAAKSATVSTSNGYYSFLGGKRPAALKPGVVDSEFAARDPFISYWQGLKSGLPEEEALAAGQSRVMAAVADYVTSTGRRTGDHVIEATGQEISGWRRALSAQHCEWCEQVAQYVYPSAESTDFGHNNDKCTAVPVYSDADPGASLNADADPAVFT